MATCHSCSAKILPGQRVCKACGEPVQDAEEERDGPDPMLGRTIASKYEIEQLLGEGAMGRVYKARQISLDKNVAIKVLHKHLAMDPKVAKRFHREARAASRLSHPNSLHIIDFGEDEDGTLYIAMELLDGDDLLTVIEHDAPLSPERIHEIMRQTLSALDTAHHSGIIHRDLKPENVVVLEAPSGEEHVKVCDFGIAKIQEADGGSAITVSGFVCGTPEYMAPEQARGEELDPRADIYAAGCMLYQMLTSELPFKAESALGIITKHLTEHPIPPRERKPEWNIPRALEAVCQKAMAKNRDERFADAASMSEALKEAVEALGPAAKVPLGSTEGDPTADFVTERSSSDEVPAETQRSIGWIAALIAVGVVAIGTALFVSSQDEGPGEVVRAGTEATQDDGTDTEPEEEGPDGPAVASAPTADAEQEQATTPDAGTAEATAEGAEEEATEAGAATAPRAAARRRRAARTARRASAMESGGSGTEAEATEEPPDPAPARQPSQSPGERAYEEGRSRFLANDVPGAIRSFEEAARLMPRNAQVHKQLGRAYMRSGNVSRAAASYRRYLELSPDAPDRAIVERIIERGGG